MSGIEWKRVLLPSHSASCQISCEAQVIERRSDTFWIAEKGSKASLIAGSAVGALFLGCGCGVYQETHLNSLQAQDCSSNQDRTVSAKACTSSLALVTLWTFGKHAACNNLHEQATGMGHRAIKTEKFMPAGAWDMREVRVSDLLVSGLVATVGVASLLQSAGLSAGEGAKGNPYCLPAEVFRLRENLPVVSAEGEFFVLGSKVVDVQSIELESFLILHGGGVRCQEDGRAFPRLTFLPISLVGYQMDTPGRGSTMSKIVYLSRSSAVRTFT
eukprot:759214-Hanusia_phi.AAC.10